MKQKKGASFGDTCAILIPTSKLIIKFVNSMLEAQGKPAWTVAKNKWGKPDFGSMNSYLKNNGIKAQYVGNGNGSLTEAEVNRDIIIMTYHSSKGLDFDHVFIPFVNSSLYISPKSEEVLFMVAMTRSRKNLYFTYTGYTHDLVDKLKDGCTEINIADIQKGSNIKRPVSDFDF